MPIGEAEVMHELNGAPATADALKALALANYGHYTSMRADDGHVRGLSLHLDRLVQDAKLIFGADLDGDRARALASRAVRGEPGSWVVRVTAFDPTLEMRKPGEAGHPHILVTRRPAPPLPAHPLRVRTTQYQRELPQAKHVGLFGALWHRREAQLDGFDDVLFVDGQSLVSEGATWNIGFFDGEQVVWPAANVLPGVTMRLLRQTGGEMTTRPIGIEDVAHMEAAFATNTTVGVRAIDRINDMELPGDHPIIDTLSKNYAGIAADPL